MPDQQFLKRFLKLNEVSTDSSDEEIHTVLQGAKWTEEEIQTALALIRGNPVDLGIMAVTKKNATLFRPDMNLSSERLSSLLGVDVVIDPTKIRDVYGNGLVRKGIDRHEAMLWLIIIILSLALAFFALWTLMYTMHFGPYQEPADWI